MQGMFARLSRSLRARRTFDVAAVLAPVVVGLSWQADASEIGNSPVHEDESSTFRERLWGSAVASIRSYELNRTFLDAQPSPTNQHIQSLSNEQTKEETGKSPKSSPERHKTYDFIVIGQGAAGRSAVQQLQVLCPNASIAVLDPLKAPRTARRAHIDYLQDYASGFQPHLQKVQLGNDPDNWIQYTHGLLVASGARAAPPPMELIETKALPYLLELRSTELPSSSSNLSLRRPVYTPDIVRKNVLDAARKGKTVAILGSGWEALDLSLAVLQTNNGRNPPHLIFGNPAPVWNILPSYLSVELKKKLRKYHVDLQDRSIVRYIATIQRPAGLKLELHTAKTYDLLDTRRVVLDCLAMAPDTQGSKGTAVLPTRQTPARMEESSDGRPWYKTWSQLTKPISTGSSSFAPSVIVCFEEDGRVVTNAELCAASKVYAAGSVAKYPNSMTGQASIAGQGAVDGAQAGRIAATNMAQAYLENQRLLKRSRNKNLAKSFAAHSLPVWRSDRNDYSCEKTGTRVGTSLSSIGIQALCVGDCDSEKYWTRAFWWTNSSAQRRLAKMVQHQEEDARSMGGGDDKVHFSRMTKRRTTRRRRKHGLVNPLYGIGCVFYVDHSGRIRGIMTWGLPFADSTSDEIKSPLLHRLAYVLRTNGGISALDSEESFHVMNNFLAEESQRIVRLAVQSHSSSWEDRLMSASGLDGPIDGFSRPLYRYTEPKPAKNSSLNVIKRKEKDFQGLMGEGLYARDILAMEEEDELSGNKEGMESRGQPSNVPVVSYPITVVPMNIGSESHGTKSASAASLEELGVFLAIQRGWEDNDNRARPAKEDPLWLRPGDEKRNMSQKQLMIDHMRSILFPHQT